MAIIESTGSFGLETNGSDEYIITDLVGSDPSIPVTDSGSPVTSADENLLAVEANAVTGGFTVLLEGANPGELYTWELDSSGVFQSENTSPDIEAMESLFDTDLNSDGLVGSTPVDQEGAVHVDTQGGDYRIVPNSGNDTPIVLTEGGLPVANDKYPDWAIVEAESDGGTGYTVVWKGVTAATDGLFLTWNVDGAGAKVGGAQLVSDLGALEVNLGVDIDGDGQIGEVVDVDVEGGVHVQTVNGEYQIVPNSGAGIPLALMDGNDKVSDDTYADWQVVEAESDGNGGYTVVWAGVTPATDGQFVSWNVDATGAKVGGASFVADVFALETSLNVDIDGDGQIGQTVTPPTIVAVDEEGGVHAQTSDGAYQIVPDSGNGTPIDLTDGGAAVADDTYLDWQVVEVESDGNGGYTVVWAGVTAATDGQYLTWNVDATGAKVGGAALVPDVLALETSLNVDIDGDGNIGATVTIVAVDEEGGVHAQTSDGAYQIVPDSGNGTPINLTDGGAAVADDTYLDWQIVEVESDGNGGYTVVWAGVTAATDGLYLTWNVDATGAKVGGAALVPDVLALETTLNVDIDGDGNIGPASVVVAVDEEGAVHAQTIDGAYQIVPDSGNGTPINLTDGGAVVADDTYLDWQIVEVESDGNGGYTVVWAGVTAATDGQYLTWNVDATGAKVGGAALVPDVLALETSLNVDIDGDGNVGPVVSVVAVDEEGGVHAQTVDGAYQIVPDSGNGTPIDLTDGGAAVADDTFADWQIVEVESDGNGGYTVVWAGVTAATDGQYLTWNVDATGAKVGGASFVADVFALETSLNVDIDGDGTIGPVVAPPTIVPVDVEGLAHVQTSDDAYQIVPDSGSGTPIDITDGGAAVTTTTFADWQIVEAEPNGSGGYTVVWAGVTAATDGQFLTWNVDAAGVKLGGAELVADLAALEVTLGVDIDGDGDVGTIVDVDVVGDVHVQTVNGLYQLVPNAGAGTPIALVDGNTPIADNTFPDWQVIHAETDGGTGYTVVWQGVTAATDGQFLTWAVDDTGAKVGGAALVSDVRALEDAISVDLDGDGYIGEKTEIEDDGAIRLVTDDSTGQFFVEDAGVPLGLTKLGDGSPFTTADVDVGVTVLGAEKIDDGSFIFLVEEAGEYRIAAADSAGVIDENADDVVTTLAEAEALFKVDLDNDGKLFVEDLGDLALKTDIATGQFFVDNGVTSLGLTKLGDGSPFTTADVSVGITPINAEKLEDGSFRILIENEFGDFEVGTATAAGVIDENEDFVAPNATTDEILFDMDLDGDGFIFIEDDGIITLKEDASTGQLVADDGVAEVEFEFANGNAVTEADFGGEVLGVELGVNYDFLVETSGGGYEMWTVASNGVGTPSLFASLTTFEAEDTFSVDLDGDSIIGDPLAVV